MSQEKVYGAAIVVAGITHDFRNWTFSVIEITGEAGIAGQVWSLIPLFIIAQRISIGLFEPWKISFSFSRFSIVNGQDHGAEKRRLRAR